MKQSWNIKCFLVITFYNYFNWNQVEYILLLEMVMLSVLGYFDFCKTIQIFLQTYSSRSTYNQIWKIHRRLADHTQNREAFPNTLKRKKKNSYRLLQPYTCWCHLFYLLIKVFSKNSLRKHNTAKIYYH